MSFLIPIISGLASTLIPPLIRSISDIAQGKPIGQSLGKEFLGIEPPAERAVQEMKGVDIVTRTTPRKKPGFIEKIARGVLPFAQAVAPVILKKLRPKSIPQIRSFPVSPSIGLQSISSAGLAIQRPIIRQRRRRRRKRKRKKKKKRKRNFPANRRFKRAI